MFSVNLIDFPVAKLITENQVDGSSLKACIVKGCTGTFFSTLARTQIQKNMLIKGKFAPTAVRKLRLKM